MFQINILIMDQPVHEIICLFNKGIQTRKDVIIQIYQVGMRKVKTSTNN
jgi:hypothetical protein